MTKINVSGSIVTYNNGMIIERCVESLLDSTKGVDFKLIVSDNQSVDGTAAFIKERFKSVQVIENPENGGFGYGHNQTIPYLDSKYHAVINPDIYIDTDVVSQLVYYLEEHPDVGMVSPRVLNSDKTEQFLPKKDPKIKYVVLSKFKPFKHYRREYTRQDEHINKPTKVDLCSGSFFIIRTDIFKQIGGFDNRFFMYYEDADLSRRVRQSWDLVFNPEAYVYHEWKRDNTKSVRGIKNFMASMIKYFSKWRK